MKLRVIFVPVHLEHVLTMGQEVTASTLDSNHIKVELGWCWIPFRNAQIRQNGGEILEYISDIKQIIDTSPGEDAGTYRNL